MLEAEEKGSPVANSYQSRVGNEIFVSVYLSRRYPMNQIEELTNIVNEFREARNWRQFHSFKDMALSLMLEAGEVAEHFQWKNEAAMVDHVAQYRAEFGAELADVLYWILALADDAGVDLDAAFRAKMEENALKYPVEKAKDSAVKWDKL